MCETDDAWVVGDYQRTTLGATDAELVQGQEGGPTSTVLPQPRDTFGSDIVVGDHDAPQAASKCV